MTHSIYLQICLVEVDNKEELLIKLWIYLLVLLILSLEIKSILILQEKQIILWLHNLVDQFGDGMYVLFTDKRFLDKIKYIITVSEYHKQDVIKKTGIDPDKVIVIYNAIDFVENDLSKFNNVKIPELVYTSAPERGLGVAIKALSKLDLDFKLNIFFCEIYFNRVKNRFLVN